MNVLNRLISLINLGKKGKNKGLSSGFPKLDKVIFGTQRRYMTTIAGDSGSGKSSLALYMYVYRPIMEAINTGKNVNILYFSFEMSSEVLFAKLLSIYIYEAYGKKVSYEQILSLTSEISDDDYSYIKKSIPWLNELEKRITIVDNAVVPKAVYALTMKWLDNFGYWEEQGENKVWVPKDPEQYLIGVIDHIRLVAGDGTVKAKIDEACDYAVSIRNRTSMSWCIVQQLNRGFKNMDRRTSGYNLLQLDDLSDSSAPAQSSEVVLGIFDAYREKMKSCENYKVDLMMDSFRLLQVMKNRFGVSNKNVGLMFHGSVGFWEELPKPDSITDYSKYTEEQKEVQPKTGSDQNVSTDKTTFTFTF